MSLFRKTLNLLQTLSFKAFTNSSPSNGDVWFDGTDICTRAGGSTRKLTVSQSANGVLIGNGLAEPAVTAVGTAGEFLVSNGSGVAPTFQHQMIFSSFTANNPVANVTAQNSYDYDKTVTGASVGDLVILTPPVYAPAKLIATGWVSSANTVRIRFSNIGTTTINSGNSGTWQICIIKP